MTQLGISAPEAVSRPLKSVGSLSAACCWGMHHKLIGQPCSPRPGWAGDLTSSPAVENAAQFSTLHQSWDLVGWITLCLSTISPLDPTPEQRYAVGSKRLQPPRCAHGAPYEVCAATLKCRKLMQHCAGSSPGIKTMPLNAKNAEQVRRFLLQRGLIRRFGHPDFQPPSRQCNGRR
jgi:hypothetical protein